MQVDEQSELETHAGEDRAADRDFLDAEYSLTKRTMPAKGPLQSPVARRHPHTDLDRDTGDECAS